MSFQKKLCERSFLIRAIVRFQNSIFYPILFALICIVSGLGSKDTYLPMILILTVLVLLSAVFSDDNKVFFVPMLMVYYALGNDYDELFVGDRGKLLMNFDLDGFKTAIAFGVVMAVAVFTRLIADGTVANALKKRGLCFWGIISLDIAFLFNGAFSEKWTPVNLIYGAITGIAITVFYLVALSISERSKDPVPYACKTLVCTSFVALVQASVVIGEQIRVGGITTPYVLNRSLPWGVATIVGAVICMGIPAALYLAAKCRFSFISYMTAFVLWGGTFIVNSRGASITGAIMLVIGIIASCVGGKNKIECRFYTVMAIIELGVVVFLVDKYLFDVSEMIDKALVFFRFENLAADSRITLWKKGIEDFRSSPVFGVGFNEGSFTVESNLYSGMYHSIIMQLLASMGIVGFVMFLVHLKHVAEVLIRRASAEKLLLLLVPFGVIIASMVDNFFFYPNFQIFYAVFLALAEHLLEKSREERLLNHRRLEGSQKPRVVFTYVEAGKGHIVPEKAVCDSFKRKYGGEFEIVESYFYSDAGDKKLQKTEKLFAAAVKKQNKSRILSWLCRTGNWVCGDRFALYFLMTFTFSGMQSRRKAELELEDIDADIIFTTHWSTAFYASLLEEPPYMVMLCPDAYSNGMFNVDVNDLLIPSESGKKDAERIRTYGGGNITAIDFPIREEAIGLYGKRDEIRAELGVEKDEFVVTMSDGGYGLANMEDTIYKLLKTDAKLTLFALCGTNRDLFERLSSIKATEGVKLIPISFTNDVLKYIAASDLFCGKSGANSMAEPAFFGVPIIITRSITYIERKIKKYYVKELGGALSIPFPRLAAKKIAYFSEHREALEPYSKGLDKVKGKSGTESVSDLLYDRIKNRMYK